jgi:two-component system, NtrC family, sensor kinase
MAKTSRKAGKRVGKAVRGGLRAKSNVAKAGKLGLGKAKSTKPEPREHKSSLKSDNARLNRLLKAARMQQEASAEILRAVANASGDVGRPLQQIAETSARLFGAPSVSIQLAEDGEFTREYRVGAIAQRVGSAYPRSNIRVGGRNLPGTVVFENRQIHIPDLDHLDPSMSDFPGLPHARAGGARTVCGTPLRREGKSIGVLIIFRNRLLPFTEDELALQQSFADQAVIAIENARLFNEVEAKTRDLSESLQQQTATADVLKVISRSAFDLQTVFNTLIDSAVALSGALSGTICLRDGDGYRYVATSSDMQSDFAKWLFEHPPTHGRASAAGRVLVSGKVEEVPDILDDPDYTLPVVSLNRTRSVIGVPLLGKDRLEGVLALTRAEPGHFTQRQIELVQTFADQAVIAIENVRLFDEVQARTKELAASLDELRTAQDRLVQTEKLASLGQLTAGIAHEIKNPLNFVNNFSALSAELVEEVNDVLAKATLDTTTRGELDELTQILKSNLEKVVQHGKRADSIVKNMLLHSREGSGEQRPADINTIVDESLNLAYHGARAEKAGFSIAFQRDLDPAVGMADVYPQEITRVLLNLISNGFYATTKRKAEAGEGFEPILSATTKNLGDKVEIRIRDNGTGIPDEVKDKIFNPFFTTKPSGEGTGLGLSMSHDIIVKQHGGSIDVVTEPGLFTEFKILLPRTNQR